MHSALNATDRCALCVLQVGSAPAVLKCNPLKSTVAMDKLNPAASSIKKRAAEESKKKSAKKVKKTQAMRDLQKKYYKSMVAEE